VLHILEQGRSEKPRKRRAR